MTLIKFYLPEQADNYLSVKGQLERYFSQKFGGFTRYHGHGGWMDDDSEVIKEPVSVYEVYTTDSHVKAMKGMRNIARHVRRETGESAVMFAINHDHVLVTED